MHLPDRAARVAAARMARPWAYERSVPDLQRHQPQVRRAQQTQWQPSYLVRPNRRVVSRVDGSVPRKASRSPLRHRHVIGEAERAGGRSLLGSRSLIWAGAMDRRAPERAGVRNPLSAERGGTGTGSPYAYFSYDRQAVRNFTRPQPACPWI